MKKLLLAIVLICSLFAESIPVEISSSHSKKNFVTNSAGKLTTTFRVKNIGDKTIKYMYVNIVPINKVGDVMYPEIGEYECRITGPIKPGRSFNGNLDCSAYYRGYIRHVMIRVNSVTYMDGSESNTPTEYYIWDDKVLSNLYLYITFPLTLIALYYSFVILF